MAFKLTITDDADSQLRALPAREQRILESAIVARLRDRPATPTGAIKRLRPNAVAELELRVGDLRVLYDVVDEEVVLLLVGRKVGNLLIVDGEEFHEHQGDPTESTGGGSAEDPQ